MTMMVNRCNILFVLCKQYIMYRKILILQHFETYNQIFTLGGVFSVMSCVTEMCTKAELCTKTSFIIAQRTPLFFSLHNYFENV